MILTGDCTKIMPTLEEEKYDCCITSPPYLWVRDYGISPTVWPEITYIPMTGIPAITVPSWTGCLGLEPTVTMFIAHIVYVFRMVWRLLRKDGTLWLNFGDTYYGSMKGCNADGSRNFKGKDKDHGGRYTSEFMYKAFESEGLKPKDLIMVPARAALALQADGWYLRSDSIWYKPNAMPESARDRPSRAHEFFFLLSKSRNYYFDMEAIKEPCVQDEMANGFRGGAYVNNSTFDNQAGGKRTQTGNTKINRANSFARKVNEQPPPGQPNQHRPDRPEVEYSGMRNKRTVMEVATQPFPEAHFATMPEKLAAIGVVAGSRVGGTVFDPFGGAGTLEKVALENNRESTIIEIGPQYVEIAERRTAVIQTQLIL